MAGLLHMIMAQWSEPSFLESNIIPRLRCVLAFVGYEGVWAKFYFIFLFLMGFPSEVYKNCDFFSFLLKTQTQKIREDYWEKIQRELPKSPHHQPSIPL